jgi:hypothetical protein
MKIQRLNNTTDSPEMMTFAEWLLFRFLLPFVTFMNTGAKLLDMKFVAFLFFVLTSSIPGVAQHLVKDGYLVASNGDTAKVPIEHYEYENGNLIFSKLPYYFGCPCDSVERFQTTYCVYDSSYLIGKTISDGTTIENYEYKYHTDNNGKWKLSSVNSHSYSMARKDRSGEWAKNYNRELYNYENEKLTKIESYKSPENMQCPWLTTTYKYDEQNRIRWEFHTYGYSDFDSPKPDVFRTDTFEYIHFDGGYIKKVLLLGEAVNVDSFFVNSKSEVLKHRRIFSGSNGNFNYVKVHHYEGDRLVSTSIICDNARLKNNKLKIVYRYKEVW